MGTPNFSVRRVVVWRSILNQQNVDGHVLRRERSNQNFYRLFEKYSDKRLATSNVDRSTLVVVLSNKVIIDSAEWVCQCIRSMMVSNVEFVYDGFN